MDFVSCLNYEVNNDADVVFNYIYFIQLDVAAIILNEEQNYHNSSLQCQCLPYGRIVRVVCNTQVRLKVSHFNFLGIKS